MTHTLLARPAWLLGLTILGGCAGQIPFSRAVNQYNTDTEKSQDSAILLNVVRASQRRPLTFFDVATVTGSSPATGSLGFSIPLSNLSSTAATTAPSLSFSGGPSVAVGPVVTQDFYKGILAPVPKSTIDLFIQRGISRDVIFNLFFQKVEFKTVEGIEENKFDISVVNYPSNDEKQSAFQRIIEIFVDGGFTTSKKDADPKSIGPAYLPRDLAGNGDDLVAKAATASLEVNLLSWCDAPLDLRLEMSEDELSLHHPRIDVDGAMMACDDSAEKLKTATIKFNRISNPLPKQKSDFKIEKIAISTDLNTKLVSFGAPPYIYRIQKAVDFSKFDFQFDESLSIQSLGISRNERSRNNASGDNLLTLDMALGDFKKKSSAKDEKEGAQVRTVPPEFCNLVFNGSDSADPKRIKLENNCEKTLLSDVEIDIVPRSTYSVLYYLGEIVRRELYPDRNAGSAASGGRVITVRSSPMNYKNIHISCAAIPLNTGGRVWIDRAEASDEKYGDESMSSGQDEEGCVPLFLVKKDYNPAFLSVNYDGAAYRIPDTARSNLVSSNLNSDMTFEVMDIVTELIALNRSAKDIPTSNVFTLRGLP